ncbi:MAG: type I methionyl aminopeptidase [Clostridia bacterium]|nr:type I methionyl aminopeptidase [Clostridia bacterium]
MIILKSSREIALMREAGRLVAQTLEVIGRAIKPDVTTEELDQIAEEFITGHGAIPSFKGYRSRGMPVPFPASICASINEEVVHGIPSLRKLKDGDIISIDIGVILNGYQGDAAATFAVGDIDDERRRLLEVTQEALRRGIDQARNGHRLSDISHAIQTYVESQGFSVVRDFVGHGIGRDMHEDPQIPNFGPPGRGPRLRPGMTLAIEPMVNMGTYEVIVRPDQWTVVTADGLCSAHFEHTVAVTDDGPVILTVP